MKNINGIGGVFLDFKGNIEDVHTWYHEVLGLDMSEYGSGFITGTQLVLLSFKRDSETLPIINFRCSDITSLIKSLRDNQITIKSEITEYPYGKFAQFIDPFENLIELWEPNEEAYIEMVQNEIKKYQKKKKTE